MGRASESFFSTVQKHGNWTNDFVKETDRYEQNLTNEKADAEIDDLS